VTPLSRKAVAFPGRASRLPRDRSVKVLCGLGSSMSRIVPAFGVAMVVGVGAHVPLSGESAGRLTPMARSCIFARLRRLVVVVPIAVIVILSWGVGAADASFPGRNGVIAFDLLRSSESGMGEEEGTDRRILMVNPGSRRLVASKLCGGPLFGCQENGPAFSASGRRLAFLHADAPPGGGSDSDLWPIQLAVSQADGSSPRSIELVGSPAWAPGGKRLLVSGLGLWVVRPDGSGRQEIRAEGDNGDWSSRNRIAFEDRGKKRPHGIGNFVDIYSVRPDGSDQRRLTRRETALRPSWSPGGTRLAYIRGLGRRPGLYTMTADGTDKQFIARDAFNSAWSPDGDRIAFIRAKSLFTIRPDGGGLRLIYRARAPSVRAPLRGLSWQPL